MKIHISPPQVAMRVPLHATSSQGAADMEPRRQDYDRLDLTRQRKFRTIGRGKSESQVDEAAIALVELSVLVYDDIGTIGKTAAKLRDPRWDCLARKETATRTCSGWKPSAKSVSDLPKSINFCRERRCRVTREFMPKDCSIT